MKPKHDPIFGQEETRFNRLALDQLKQQDLRSLFQTLMTEPSNRTIADMNTLIKITSNLQPIKKLRNSSVVYHLCKSMFIAKFRQKTFIYQRQEESQSIYIILNGKVGLYKRSAQSEGQDEVVFLSEGASFGQAYNWKQKFVPLTFEQTLVAVIPKRQLYKIALNVSHQNDEVIKALTRSRIFGSQDMIRSIGGSLNLHRIPLGSFLIKEGEIPKCIFFILKGTVSKHLQLTKKQQVPNQKQYVSVGEYSVGDYFPKQKLSQCLPFSIVAQSPCEIVSLPKKQLKMLNWSPPTTQIFKGEEHYKKQLEKDREWQLYKKNYIVENLPVKDGKPRPMIF